MLQDPKSGQQYKFELKDRLIRDGEFDGWVEISVKPESDEDNQNTDKNGDTTSQTAVNKLPGDFAC